MQELKAIDIEVTEGEIIVNSGHEDCEFKAKRIYIDLVSKYADCLSLGNTVEGYPQLFLCAGEDTLKIDESNKNKATMVTLKDYKGWEILDCWVGRYTLTVILKEPQNEQ